MYNSNNFLKSEEPITVGASETDYVVTNVVQINDPLNIIIDIVVDDVALITAITAKLQTSANEGDWVDNKTATVAATAKVLRATFATKAATAAGDYVVVTDVNGLSWAVAADVTGTDPEPTGAVWTAIAAGRKTQADISAETTAAEVAAVFETAFDGLVGFSDVFTTADTVVSGSLDFTTIPAGDLSTTIAPHNTGDTGDGSISVSTPTAGTGPGTTVIKLTQVDPDDDTYLPMRPKARIVITTGADDSVTISAVNVSRQTS